MGRMKETATTEAAGCRIDGAQDAKKETSFTFAPDTAHLRSWDTAGHVCTGSRGCQPA